jgi:hypothetical protein
VQAAGFLLDSDEIVIFEGDVMKLQMTNCISCSGEMPMGATICPICGKDQTQSSARRAPVTPRTLLAVALSAAVLLIFNWIKSPPPVNQLTSPPAVTAPSR